MSQLAISPIFPPRENVFIGDVYATFIPSAIPSHPFSARPAIPTPPAVWLDSVPLDVVGFYGQRPGFASSQITYASMPDGSQLWQQPNEVIQAPQQTDSARLRLVAFPAFNFVSATATTLGLNVPGSTVGAALGLSTSADLTISISIPAAESYSVPASMAINGFLNRCRSSPNFISNYRIVESTLYQAQAKAAQVTPALILINEVFYARAIDFTYSSKSGVGANIAATLASLTNLTGKISSVEQQLSALKSSGTGNGAGTTNSAVVGNTSGTSTGGGGGSGQGGATDTPPSPQAGATQQTTASQQATTTQLEELTSELRNLRDQLSQQAQKAVPAVPGATASVVSANAMAITLRQTFSRPVAIGYRAITLTDMPGAPTCSFGGIPAPEAGEGGAPIPLAPRS